MSRRYSGPISNYYNVEHFKETAIKTINEIFGREKPYDVFDFSEDKDAGTWSAVAYYEDEDMPAEQKPGEVLSPQAEEALKPQAAPAKDAEEPEEGDAISELHVAPAKDKANGKKRNNRNA